MMRRLLLLLAIAPGCFVDEPPVDDDDAADEMAGEDASSDDGSSGEPVEDCEQAFQECTCVLSSDRPDLCVEPYFECSLDATADRDACIEGVEQCESDCGTCPGADQGCISARNLCITLCDDDCEPEPPACG